MVANVNPPQRQRNSNRELAVPQTCPHCGKTFKEKGILRTHVRLHTGEANYECPDCGKTFKQKNNLDLHVARRHSFVLPYECDLCGKAFPNKSTLQAHEVVHSDEKPFTCTMCGRGFKVKGTLKTHTMRVHEGIDLYRKRKERRPRKQKGPTSVNNGMNPPTMVPPQQASNVNMVTLDNDLSVIHAHHHHHHAAHRGIPVSQPNVN